MRRPSDRTEEDRLVQDAARRFLEKTHPWQGPAAPEAPTGDTERQQGFAGMGWFLMLLPDNLGGLGNDLHQALVVLEEAGRVLLPDPLAANILVAPQVLTALPDQRHARTLAQDISTGRTQIAWVAGGSFDKGAATFGGQTRIVAGMDTPSHLILSAPGIVALIDSARLPQGRIPCRLLDGRAGGFAPLDGLTLQSQEIVAQGQQADALSDRIRVLMTLGAAAGCLGALDAGMELTVDHLKTRHQFGQPLAALQAVQHHMANVYCTVEAFRSLIHAAATADPVDRTVLTAACAHHLRRKALSAAGTCIQVSGGIAMTEDYRMGHIYKRLQTEAGLIHG